MQAAQKIAKGGFIEGEVVQRLLKLIDFLVFFAATLITSLVAVDPVSTIDQSAIIGMASAALSFLIVLVLRGIKFYDPRALSHVFVSLRGGIAATLVCGFGTFVVLRYTILPLSQVWPLMWSCVVIPYLCLARALLAVWALRMAKGDRLRRRVAIVGGGLAAEDALQTLAKSKDIDIEIVGLFDDRLDERSPMMVGKSYKIGKIADLADYARTTRVDLIIVAIPLAAEGRLLTILQRLWQLPVDIRISGKTSGLKFSPQAYAHLGDLPLLAVFDRPLIGWGLFLKNVMERILALVGVIVLSPVMAGVALAVKLESKGPIIFKQKRYGFNNELIEVYKFRSMYTDRSDANAQKLVTKGDARVTKVGRIIRKASLDELPQLFNVLTGQLSLVGPRPHATKAKAADRLYENVVDGYFARHKVKPGITGWAQINGWRGETDTHEKIEQRVKYDLEYIDNWSLFLDLKIILKTPLALLKSENAY